MPESSEVCGSCRQDSAAPKNDKRSSQAMIRLDFQELLKEFIYLASEQRGLRLLQTGISLVTWMCGAHPDRTRTQFLKFEFQEYLEMTSDWVLC